MILVDTNVWIAYLDRGDPVLADLLLQRSVLIHPYIIGETALGRLADRQLALTEFKTMAGIVVASHDEVMAMIEAHAITRIGYVDAHLLASALLTPGTRIWTRDRRLRQQAERLGVLAPLA